MATSLVFKDPNASLVPSARARETTELGRSLGSSFSSRRIQTSTNGTFKRIVNGEQIGPAVRGEINVIVVGALPKVSRIFYEAKYDPNKEATLPDCWSSLGDVPDAKAPNKQASSCANCPQNIAGSGEGDRKACRFQRRVAVLLEGDMSGEVYQLNIPAKSLFGKRSGHVLPFEAYARYLNANTSAVDRVVTNVSYNPEADGMELQFTPTRFLSDEEIDLVEEVQGNPETMELCRITVAQVDGVTKEPARKQQARAVEEPAEEDDGVAEPQKRASARREEPEPPKGNTNKLANVMSQWADDE